MLQRNVYIFCNSYIINLLIRPSESQTGLAKNMSTIGKKLFIKIFVLALLVILQKEIDSYLISFFCVIALQIYREILKKYRKGAITLQKKSENR